MTRKLTLSILASMLLPVAAFAQLELVAARNGTLELVGPALDFGSVAVGDRSEALLRLRNSGSGVIELNRMRVTGSGFRLDGEPNLPLKIDPQQMVGFRIVFQPAQPGAREGQFEFTGGTTRLLGAGNPVLNVRVREAGGTRVLTTADRVNFGALQIDEVSEREFELHNQNAAALTVASLGVSGANYELIGPQAPLTVAPGAMVALRVRFTARRGGLQAGWLSVGSRQFGLDAFVAEPPPPDLAVEAAAAPWSSAMSTAVKVRFPTPPGARGQGVLRLEFIPLNSLTKDDPAIQFASGGRNVEFTFERGDQYARFGAAAEVLLQTGTTAGKIILTAVAKEKNSRAERDIAPQRVAPGNLSVAREQGQIRVRFTAFDNTRTAGRLLFLFTDAAGTSVPPGEIPISATKEFQDFFGRSSTAGTFSVEATFPVSGDATVIRSLQVRVENAAGVGSPAVKEF